MKCKYKSNYVGGLDCDLDALHGQDYCVIHLDFPKDVNQLSDAVKDKIIADDFNFEGSKLDQFIYYDLKTNKPIIFRDAIIQHDIKLSSKDPEIIEDAEFGALNFRGASVGGNIEFIHTTIKGQVNFGNDTEVGGNIKFHSSLIAGDVDFTDIEVDGGVFFPFTIIEGNVNFSGAKISKDIKFTNSEIGNNAIFNHLDAGQNLFFNRDLDYTKKTDLKGKKLEVKGKAEFNYIIVRGTANLNGIDIGENFNLISSNIYGSANFEDSKIGTLNSQRTVKDANFSNTEISGDSDFTRAKFYGDAIFIRTEFRGNSYFDETIFSKKADYEESRFGGNANFIDTDFANESNFTKVSFLSTGLFSGIKNALKLNSSFEESRLRNVAFRGCDLSEALFKYAIFDNCELSLAIWPKGYKILEYTKYEENKFSKTPVNVLLTNSLGILWSPELVEEARLVADTYQRIRLSLQQQGEYGLAGKFYVREMDLKREVYSHENIYMWLVYTSLSLTTGYGEKLRNILIIFLLYLSIYIIAVYYLAIPSNNLVIPIGSGILSIFTALLVYVFARKISR